MYRDPNSGIYYVSVQGAGGKRVRRSTGTTDQRLAREIETHWKVESIRISKLGERPQFTFDEIMAWRLKQQAGSRSAVTDRCAVRQLVPFFRGKIVARIGHADVDAFVAAKRAEGVGDKTIRRYLAVMSSAFTHAGESPEYRGLPNPVRGYLPRVADDDHRLRYEDKPVIHALAEAQREPVLRDLVMMAAYTGMRQGELLGLTWSRIDLHRNMIMLRPEDQKGKRHGVVWVNQTARDCLLARKRESAGAYPGTPWVFAGSAGERLKKDWVSYRFALACAAVGLEDFRFHDLRHCFCSWLAWAGVPLQRIQALARHKDMRTTAKYAHLAESHLRETSAMLDGQRSGMALAVDVEETRDRAASPKLNCRAYADPRTPAPSPAGAASFRGEWRVRT